MTNKDCNTCFYRDNDKYKLPCVSCFVSNKHVQRDLYIKEPDAVVEEVFEEDYEDAFYGSPEDYVSQPKHYTKGKYEVIDVIEDWNLNFRLANVIKYVARHEHKGKPLEDLKKALWYLQREVDSWPKSLPSKN